MSHILTITKKIDKLGYNPNIKLTVDGNEQFILKKACVTQIPLAPGTHTLEFSAVLLKKSMIIERTDDLALTVHWNHFTGAVDVETDGGADAVPPPDSKKGGGLQEGVQSAQQSLKEIWNGLKEEALKVRQDAAVRAAYKEEEEKRKPRTERVEHRRELTQQEQQTIDLAELERSKLYQDYLEKKLSLADYWSRSTVFNRKIQEIKGRAVWYETIEYPPEVDPSVPIVIDEEAIRNSVK